MYNNGGNNDDENNNDENKPVMHYHGVKKEDAHLYKPLGNKYKIERKNVFNSKYKYYGEHLGKNGMGILKHYKLCTVCNFFYRDDINTDAFFLFKQSVYTKCLYCERDLLVVKYYDNHIRDMHSYGSNVTVVFPPEEVHFGPVKFEKEHFDERRCIYFDGIDLFYIHSKIIDGDDIGVKRIGGVIIKQGIKLPSEISFDQKEIFIYEFIVTDGSYFEKK